MTARLKHLNPVRLSPAPMQAKSLVQPFLKWAGGKRQLLPYIKSFIPKSFDRYFEPFVGGGAVLFDLKHPKAFINDANGELINLYEVIRDDPDALLSEVEKHKNAAKNKNDEKYFYQLREQDRDDNLYNRLSEVERAARILYLNKTCFNGLFRVNSQGQFNAPFGKYPNPNIAHENIIRAVSKYLKGKDISITSTDFAKAVKTARAGDFIYFDPPYDPVSDTSSFTGYHKSAFGRSEQTRLFKVFKDLDRRGCKVMLSNSDTRFIRDLYKGYTKEDILATRRINAVGSGRGAIREVLIMNYG